MLADFLVGSGLSLAALAKEFRAVGVLVLYEVMVEDLSMQAFVVPHLPPAHSLRSHRVPLLDPVDDVDVMDVLVDDEVAREPREVIPVAELVLQFALIRQPLEAR